MNIMEIGYVVRLIFVYKFNIKKMREISKKSKDIEDAKNIKVGGVFVISSCVLLVVYGIFKYWAF